ncbi:hypothetical protein FH972_014676 [Carpinus fangiana]|uniref:Uncharacterized protein n=1 Tax=Carpinus fangiana TaxID=176857 RepID=A0A5N6RB29_9ROSI|nr:hypothetical protein FH972_014676 [Carpinus fangiana]
MKGKGIVDGGWVQQRLILGHPSLGCFVTHCGSGSLLEALRMEKGEEDGLFTRGSVCKAVRTVMGVDSEVGRVVRANHTKLRDLLLSEDLQSSYINSFC